MYRRIRFTLMLFGFAGFLFAFNVSLQTAHFADDILWRLGCLALPAVGFGIGIISEVATLLYAWRTKDKTKTDEQM